jgi:predicted DCC family thiol-disulfide oxidoreductase YuxK
MLVYYDGGCPVCSREIAFYRARPGAAAFDWVNVTHCPPEALGFGLSRAEAMARMHVRLDDGTLLNGAAAFGAMWRKLPGFKGLGWLLAMPPFETLADWAYTIWLVARKLWR